MGWIPMATDSSLIFGCLDVWMSGCLDVSQALEQAVLDREQALQDPSLPFLEFEDIMATVGEKLPINVSDSLYALLTFPDNAVENGTELVSGSFCLWLSSDCFLSTLRCGSEFVCLSSLSLPRFP